MTTILVTGATGKQGGSVITSLLEKSVPFKILAVTRNLDHPAAIFENVKRQTSTPVWGVFSVQTANPRNDDERRQGMALIDESVKQGVKYFVYSSVDRGGERSDQNPTQVPHFIFKHEIEKHLKEKAKGTDMEWTILRPVAFFENLTPDYFGKVFTTAWQMSLEGKPLQLVATSDIGFFAAAAFTNPEALKNHACSLAGDELTFDQMSETFKQLTGKNVPTTFSIPVRLMMAAVKELGVMFKWFHDEGYGADIPTLKKLNPGLKAFGDWLKEDSKFETR
ncbi:Peptidase C12, ubiquitin carboxyl-terminal hydrolase 1 [Penicillium expansum]|nr:Peptidase C12, ubiquitin carboxyl-terminal hydrolase 1 [Penicillium expansum]